MNHVVRVLGTAGGQVTGEASGVSSITMDGVAPSDGGSVAQGFGVSATSSDGFITSDQPTASGSVLGSVQPFDQVTEAAGRPAAQSADEYATVNGGCAGMFASGAGLYDKIDPVTGTDSFSVLNPVVSGTISRLWTPPHGFGAILCAADNQATPDAALLSVKPGPKLMISAADVAAGTFTDQFNLTAPLSTRTLVVVGGFAQDTGLGDAVVALNDGNNPGGPATVAVANLRTGLVTAIAGVTTGFPSGVAVDSGTHQAVVGSFEGFGVYNLGTGAGTLVQPGGSTYQHPAADPVRQEFLVEEVASPDLFGSTPNNNSMSSVLLTDESGHLLRRIEQFNFFNIFLLDMGDYLQVNSSSATAFALGPGGSQLYPFHY